MSPSALWTKIFHPFRINWYYVVLNNEVIHFLWICPYLDLVLTHSRDFNNASSSWDGSIHLMDLELSTFYELKVVHFMDLESSTFYDLKIVHFCELKVVHFLWTKARPLFVNYKFVNRIFSHFFNKILLLLCIRRKK